MRTHQRYIPPILSALIVAIMPLVGSLPLWIIAWCTVMWGYAFFSKKLSWPWPNKAISRGLTVAGIIGLLLTFNAMFGPEAFLGLLALMAGLKPFEIETHRDRMITIFLAYFIVITSLLQSESILIILYMLVSVCITTAALIRINDPFGRFKDNLKLSGLIMVQAIPLMIILFFMFPRIQGSLFGLTHAGVAKTGFSENLSPGSVAQLVENDEVVFRATFEDKIPPPELLYWRGIVFQNFDGKKWRRQWHLEPNATPPNGKNIVKYSVMLEPSGRRWLFALEMGSKIPKMASLYEDYTFRSRRSINRKTSYSLTSYTRYDTGPEDDRHLRNAKQLPRKGNPEARKLASRLTQGVFDVDEKIKRVLAYFEDTGFFYTLEPPTLGKNTIDDFLFKSRKGYCEHYATAFTFLLRAAGIPARIVGGYLGGEINPYGNYLIIRQADAHVWVEAWQQKTGWQRVDPTAVVAPERISSGVEAALQPGELTDFFSFKYLGNLTEIIKQFRYGWDAVTLQWNAWFQGYSYDQQRELLEKIGINIESWVSSFKVLLLALVLIVVIFSVYAFFSFMPEKQKPDKVRKYYRLFTEKLKKIGVERKSDMGPLAYLAYISKFRPDLSHKITEITELYIQLRFRKEAPETQLPLFIKKVKEFNPVLK